MSQHRIGDIYAEASGAGEPVVLLHGNGESIRTMRRQQGALRPDFRVIAIDARAHGESARGSGPLTIARLADDVAAVLAALAPGSSAHVVGYSDGANVALELALRHPDSVRSLVLIAGHLRPEGLAARSLWAMRAVEAGLRVAAGCSRWARTKLEIWRLMTRDPHIDPADLGRIDVPALVLVGERDLIRPAHSRLIASSLPHGRLVVVAGTGHRLIHAKAAQVNALIRAFLVTPRGPA